MSRAPAPALTPNLAPNLNSFSARLRSAAEKPLILWPCTLAITLASLWTWANTTLALNSAFQPMGDFVAYYNAASDLNHGLDPYLRFDPTRPFSLSLGYVYPPFLARALQPLALLSLPQAELVAVLFLQACVLVSAVLLWRLLGLQAWPARLLALDSLLLCKGVATNLEDGQVNLLLMALTTAFLAAWVTGSRASFVFAALNISLKLQQVPLLGLALIRRHWSSLMLALAIIAGTLVVGGPSLSYEYFTGVLPKLASTIPTGAQNTSLLADIERLLHPGADNLAYDPSYPEVRILALLILAPIAVLTIRALLLVRDRRAEALLTVTAVPLASTYLAPPHLIQFLPAYIVLLAHAAQRRAWILCGAAIGAMLLVAEYPLFFTSASAWNYFVARALFYELGPGVAALVLWVVALILAFRTPIVSRQ